MLIYENKKAKLLNILKIGINPFKKFVATGEIKEELGIDKIKRIKLGEIFDQEEPKYKKTWIVHPVLVEVDTDNIKLDWEAQSYKWVTLKEAMKFKLLPGFDIVLKKLSLWIQE